MGTADAVRAAAARTKHPARATTRMPGGRTLKLTPLLITLAFLFPATTGALPVADEAPWGAWYTERIVDQETGNFNEVAIGVKSNDDPVAAFLSGHPVTGKATLAFVERVNGQWILSWPTGESVAPDIVVGSDDTIHMTLREFTSPSSVALNYGTRTNGIWTFETIHADGSVGPLAPMDLDPNGYPHILYFTSNHPDLSSTARLAYKDANGWHHEVIDPDTYVSPRSDLAVDNQGRVHAVYTDLIGPNTINTHHALRSLDGTWTITNLPDCATTPTIDTDSTNTPHVACEDEAGLVYYTQVNGQWVREVADNGCGGDLILCRAPYESGADPSLQVDDQDRPHIVYRYEHVYDGTELLWQTHPLYAVKVDGTWHVEVIDRDGWHHGYQPDIELDADGVPHVVFVTGWETVPAGTKGVNRAVYATPLAPHIAGVVG